MDHPLKGYLQVELSLILRVSLGCHGRAGWGPRRGVGEYCVLFSPWKHREIWQDQRLAREGLERVPLMLLGDGGPSPWEPPLSPGLGGLTCIIRGLVQGYPGLAWFLEFRSKS